MPSVTVKNSGSQDYPVVLGSFGKLYVLDSSLSNSTAIQTENSLVSLQRAVLSGQQTCLQTDSATVSINDSLLNCGVPIQSSQGAAEAILSAATATTTENPAFDIQLAFTNANAILPEGTIAEGVSGLNNNDSELYAYQFDACYGVGILLDEYTYTNTEQAWVYGFEVEANASKQFLHGDWLDLNIDFAYSRSDAGGRRLQGQPEYLAGVQLFYQPANSRFTLNLNYRLNGSETEIVSPNLLVPDVELAPRAELNLGVRYAANSKLILNANINNLTNDAFKYRQGNELFRQYKLGRTFEFGVHYKFN
ncbi:TonB-dependent receptor domain-containing protein [Gayadomonas joobiniege]|uniref:TonB-dependent receptor domain-containing protein n=1 Tax=Gayadomonas joobiniege TaxID=1234606 RepID=UPI00036C73F9|nr:TonB-dependent receptor [Gayadomonas joobiniege]